MTFPENKLVTRDVVQGHDKEKCTFGNNPSIKVFSEYDIEIITSSYGTLIGKGGFGEVYRGVLDNELVAVKKCICGDLRKEFMEEVSIHGQMDHDNVVKLIGYCSGENTLAIVTEYISNGNLDDALHNSNISISLDARLEIAIGCADALSYMHLLHLSSDSLVCHGDIKPANILLHDNLIVKVSDFGISRHLSGGITRYTSTVKGSLDYMDPICLQEGRLTSKNDVYSFGAVLLELISRSRIKQGDFSLVRTFCEACRKGKELKELFDVEIANESNMKILEEIAKLATACLTLDIDKRPRIHDVAECLRMLKYQKVDTNHIRIFMEDDIKRITGNYCTLIGKHGFGEMYRGVLYGDVVAVKTNIDRDLREQFVKEVSIHSQINHENIVKLIGYCTGENTLAMVTEYTTKGNLSEILHNRYISIPLDIRLSIAIGCAEALSYMHSMNLCHGDIKTSNILLDDNFTAKVSNFSLSLFLPGGITQYTDHIVGSISYTDPVHFECGLFTPKSDVYSFGVVLFELISRKKLKQEDISLIEYFRTGCSQGPCLLKLFDSEIAIEKNMMITEEIARLATKCMTLDLHKRPKMNNVAKHLWMLWRSMRRRACQTHWDDD